MPDSTGAIQTIAIFGPGLIGSSFGLGLRKAGFGGTILGVGASPYIEPAAAIGAIDSVSSFEQAVEVADLLYLSGTVDGIVQDLTELSGNLTEGSIVTDVGSTKRFIVNHAWDCIPPQQFIGGHPMAGKEKRGAEHADADLFRGRPYVLTSSPESAVAEDFLFWLQRLGAGIVFMEAGEHDATVAFSSHLPQLLSTALACTLARQDHLPVDAVSGSGLRDMTRLALSSPDLWRSILATNEDEIQKALDSFIKTLSTIRNHLGSNDVLDSFTIASKYVSLLKK